MQRILGVSVTLILLRLLSLHHASGESFVDQQGKRFEQEHPEATLPVAPHCGAPLSERLIGSLRTQIDEFPWTALIEYRDSNGQTEFLCGGSLINFRYILTAAHCMKASGWEVSGVRLGEWDLATDQDCEHEYCTDAPVNVGIEKIIAHENYSRKTHYNDIALIRLNRTVERSSSISPVCLPIAEPQRSQDMLGKNGYVAGWGGKTDGRSSNVKLKTPTKITDCGNYTNVFGRLKVVLKDTQMCATGFSNRDSCGSTVTSGSPVTTEEYSNQYHTSFNYQYGISSMGSRHCGSNGIPDVYTNVAKYIDWIQSKME